MRWLGAAIDDWRAGGSRTQLALLGGLIVLDLLSTLVSLHSYTAFPIAGFFVWLLLGRLLLRFRQLLVLVAVIFVTATIARFAMGASGAWTAEAALVICCVLVLYAASRFRGSLPGPLSEALLAQVRARLSAQGQVRGLPDDWRLESHVVAAWNQGYAGDFLVADLDDERRLLELVLVDVVGKGVRAAPSALLFAGALGGQVGQRRGADLLEAANEFLLRHGSEETMATAVHVSLDLGDGRYEIRSAGHPPALRWERDAGRWVVDVARGLALGVQPHPELESSTGRLARGEGLMFYTDGLVETPGGDIDDGIAWLGQVAGEQVRASGFEGLPQRVLRTVGRGDDDRALLVIWRR